MTDYLNPGKIYPDDINRCGRDLAAPTAEHSSGVEEPTVSKRESVGQGPEPGGEGEG